MDEFTKCHKSQIVTKKGHPVSMVLLKLGCARMRISTSWRMQHFMRMDEKCGGPQKKWGTGGGAQKYGQGTHWNYLQERHWEPCPLSPPHHPLGTYSHSHASHSPFYFILIILFFKTNFYFPTYSLNVMCMLVVGPNLSTKCPCSEHEFNSTHGHLRGFYFGLCLFTP